MAALTRLCLSFRIFYLFMALHIINVSIDPPDHYVRTAKHNGREDLSINEMESITEWVLEKVLKIKNAVPEKDEPDNPHKLTKTTQQWFCSVAEQLHWPEAKVKIPVARSLIAYQCPRYFLLSSDITSPPPESILSC